MPHTVCIVPLKPKFFHPLRAVRAALKKSQPEFAKMFGVSASYIQAIELGQRKLSDELADAIMLRLGVDAESLKRKIGAPVSLISSENAEFTVWSRMSPKRGDLDGLERVDEEYETVRKVGDPNERFRLSLAFWQKRIVPSWKSEQWMIREGLNNKLEMLFEAAERENKYHALTMRLSRWIENAVTEFRLRTTINAIRSTRTGYDAQWPTFMETLSKSFRLKPSRSQRRCQLPRRQRRKKG
jgi:transcriptional regulator with XRE-family HTH domain